MTYPDEVLCRPNNCIFVTILSPTETPGGHHDGKRGEDAPGTGIQKRYPREDYWLDDGLFSVYVQNLNVIQMSMRCLVDPHLHTRKKGGEA